MKTDKLRRGTTLIEAILAMTILSMLLVPMVSLLKASHVLWHKYESGHGGVSVRQEVAFEIGRILANARRLQSISDREIQFLNANGGQESLYQSGADLIWERDGLTEVLAQEIGSIQFSVVEKASEKLGQLIEITVANADNTAMAHKASAIRVWINPGI